MVRKPQGKIANLSLEDIKARIKSADLNTFFIFGAILLILIVGVFALFSAESSNAVRGNPACGKIVIATNGSSLASTVSPTLHEARYFLVLDPLSRKLIEVIKNPYRGLQPDPQIAYLIAGKGEEAVIVGTIDQQSYDIFGQFGIRVFGGYQGRAQRVVKLYRQARISATPDPNANAPQTITTGQPPRLNAQGGLGVPGGIPANVGVQNMQGAGVMYQPGCPLPGRVPGTGMGMGMRAMQQQPMQGAGMMYQPGCPLPVNTMQNTQGAVNNFGQGTQVGWFGLGQQAFICPTCNWRMKADRQGNGFPVCPNCGAPAMALDMGNQGVNQNNREAGIMPEGMWAANTTGMNPQFNQGMNPQFNQMNNQMVNQPNMVMQGGPDLTGAFLCPNCNWRMYSQQGANEFPQCPNCGQIMARTATSQQVALTQNGVSTTPQASAAGAPPIFRDAVMPHAYRGVCENCHTVMADVAIPANAQMPHPYRGVCSNCHQISGLTAGVQGNANAMPVAFAQPNAVQPNAVQPNVEQEAPVRMGIK